MGVRHILLVFSKFWKCDRRHYRFCDKVIANCASDGFVTASLTVHQLVDYIQWEHLAGDIFHDCLDFSI